jgi:hypothetical protein
MFRMRAPGTKKLLFLMSVFSETLLTLVRCHFVLLSFFPAWHTECFFTPFVLPGTSPERELKGRLNNLF